MNLDLKNAPVEWFRRIVLSEMKICLLLCIVDWAVDGIHWRLQILRWLYIYTDSLHVRLNDGIATKTTQTSQSVGQAIYYTQVDGHAHE